MSLSGIAQFILGFLLGVFILTGAGAATAYWFFNRMSDSPSKPNFSEESSSENTKQTKTSQSNNPDNQQQESASKQNNFSAQTASASSEESENTKSNQSEKSEPEQEPTMQERFGEQAYKARVTWPNGLSLRDRPSVDSSRVGGVYYDDQLVIIENSSDGDWQKVYVPETGEKAWVKAGNVEKIN